MTVQEIIDRAGGYIHLPPAIGITAFGAKDWVNKGIPEKYGPSLAERTGLSIDEIAGASDKARRRGKRWYGKGGGIEATN